ncbi:MAG: hypothetical protein IT429_17330, partial [Gemmataceae bacterium]|nr:hypothetical protein [Gemmataceae bacterium]
HPNQAEAWDQIVDWGADQLRSVIRQRNLDAAVVKRLEGELKTLQTLAKQSHRQLFKPLKGVGGYPRARYTTTPCPPMWKKTVMGWVPPELRVRVDAFQRAIAGLKSTAVRTGASANYRLGGGWRGFTGGLGAIMFLTGDVRDIIPPGMYRAGVDPYAPAPII